MDLSIVIPVYNEEQRLPKTIDALNNFVATTPIVKEVVFINDGSFDQTVSVIDRNPKNFDHQLISYASNRGKGYALKQGVLKTSGDYVLIMDADLSTPLTELHKFKSHLETNVPMVIGSRKTAGANVIKHQTVLRQKLGEGFTILSNLMLRSGVSDFTCGFKAFRQDVAKKLFASQKIDRWGYDSEIIFLARKYGFEIVEVPVTWENDDRTKVNLLKDVYRSFSDLIKIRYFDVTNQYQK